jgi:hypothetical protein
MHGKRLPAAQQRANGKSPGKAPDGLATLT